MLHDQGDVGLWGTEVKVAVGLQALKTRGRLTSAGSEYWQDPMPLKHRKGQWLRPWLVGVGRVGEGERESEFQMEILVLKTTGSTSLLLFALVTQQNRRHRVCTDLPFASKESTRGFFSFILVLR